MPVLISADHRVSVEHPIEFNPLLYKAKSLIYITLPTSTTCPAPQLRSHFIDTYLKSQSWRIFARKGAMQCISRRFDTVSSHTIVVDRALLLHDFLKLSLIQRPPITMTMPNPIKV